MFIYGNDYTLQVERLVHTSEAIKCAIAFWGEKAAKLLGDKSKKAHIICNLESGGTNPNVIKHLLNNGSKIRTNDKLHAKVWLGNAFAIVGSANASANGLSYEDSEIDSWGWIEAGVLIKNPVIVKKIDDWFKNLWNDPNSEDVNEDKIKSALAAWKPRRKNRLPLKRSESFFEQIKTEPNFLKDRQVYLLFYDEDLSKKGKKILKEKFPGFFAYEDWPVPSDSYFIEFHHPSDTDTYKFIGIYKTLREKE